MIFFGTNPIAWSNDDDQTIGAHLSLDDCLSDCRKIGFDGIEKGHKMPNDGAELKAKLGEYGLKFIGGWHSTNLLTNDIETELAAMQGFIDMLKAAGSKTLIAAECSNTIHGSEGIGILDRPVMKDEEWARFTQGLTTLAQEAARQGIELCYHHHMGTVIQTEEEIDRLMAETSDAVNLLLDTGHCYFGGGDPTALAKRHMGRVRHIHCKNIRAEVMERVISENMSFLDGVRQGVFTVPGDAEGVVDFPSVLKEAARAGYQGWLVIEAEQDSLVRNPLHYQSMGYGALKDMAAHAGLS